MIAVAGCVAQAEGEEIARRAPAVDIVVGPQAYHRPPQMIAEIHRGAGRALDTEFPGARSSTPCPPTAARPASRLPHRSGRLRQVLHLLRRALYARRRIFARLARLDPRRGAAQPETGAREITLLGQNVNAYRAEGPDGSDWGLARLARARRHRRPRPHPLHDQPSARHGRRSHRRPPRRPRADAVPASAGAVGSDRIPRR